MLEHTATHLRNTSYHPDFEIHDPIWSYGKHNKGHPAKLQDTKRPVEMRCTCNTLELGRRVVCKTQGVLNFLICHFLMSSPLFILWRHWALVMSEWVSHCVECLGYNCPSAYLYLRKVQILQLLAKYQNQNYQSESRDFIFLSCSLVILMQTQHSDLQGIEPINPDVLKGQGPLEARFLPINDLLQSAENFKDKRI